VADARAWVRRTLPEHLDRAVRADLVDDLDLVVSELAGNALRHGDQLRGLRLHRHDQRIRVAVSDGDDREPTRRHVSSESEGGRGLFLVDALVDGWGVDHDLERGGKTVWADLAL
jgi:anti-sigma regulatory factor (Ser/Thr protein kinase)